MNGIMKLTLVATLGFFASGCWIVDLFTGPHGFKVKTTFTALPSPTQNQLIFTDPNVSVSGQWLNDTYGSLCGGQFSFDGNTGGDGQLNISDARVPANWRIARFGGHTGCDRVIASNSLFLTCGAVVTINCGAGSVFAMSPNQIDVNAPPATATFAGEGLNTTYGMPTIEFYDEYGTFFNQTTATYVSGDGTWLQGNVPSLAGLYSGTYTVVIVNATSDASRDAVGAATVWIYGNDMPPPPPDPDPDPTCGIPYNGQPALECNVY